MGNCPNNYEIGYYNPDQLNKWSILLNAAEVYDSEHTLKPFGHSTVLVEDCKKWEKQMNKWFPTEPTAV